MAGSRHALLGSSAVHPWDGLNRSASPSPGWAPSEGHWAPAHPLEHHENLTDRTPSGTGRGRSSPRLVHDGRRQPGRSGLGARIGHQPADTQLRMLGALGFRSPQPRHGPDRPDVLAGVAGQPEHHVELERPVPRERRRQPPGRRAGRTAVQRRSHPGRPVRLARRGRRVDREADAEQLHPHADRRRQARRRLHVDLHHEAGFRPDHPAPHLEQPGTGAPHRQLPDHRALRGAGERGQPHRAARRLHHLAGVPPRPAVLPLQ